MPVTSEFVKLLQYNPEEIFSIRWTTSVHHPWYDEGMVDTDGNLLLIEKSIVDRGETQIPDNIKPMALLTGVKIEPFNTMMADYMLNILDLDNQMTGWSLAGSMCYFLPDSKEQMDSVVATLSDILDHPEKEEYRGYGKPEQPSNLVGAIVDWDERHEEADYPGGYRFSFIENGEVKNQNGKVVGRVVDMQIADDASGISATIEMSEPIMHSLRNVSYSIGIGSPNIFDRDDSGRPCMINHYEEDEEEDDEGDGYDGYDGYDEDYDEEEEDEEWGFEEGIHTSPEPPEDEDELSYARSMFTKDLEYLAFGIEPDIKVKQSHQEGDHTVITDASLESLSITPLKWDSINIQPSELLLKKFDSSVARAILSNEGRSYDGVLEAHLPLPTRKPPEVIGGYISNTDSFKRPFYRTPNPEMFHTSPVFSDHCTPTWGITKPKKAGDYSRDLFNGNRFALENYYNFETADKILAAMKACPMIAALEPFLVKNQLDAWLYIIIIPGDVEDGEQRVNKAVAFLAGYEAGIGLTREELRKPPWSTDK